MLPTLIDQLLALPKARNVAGEKKAVKLDVETAARLKTAGITARVYLRYQDALSEGPATVRELMCATHSHRAAVSTQLEKLKKIGFVTVTTNRPCRWSWAKQP